MALLRSYSAIALAIAFTIAVTWAFVSPGPSDVVIRTLSSAVFAAVSMLDKSKNDTPPSDKILPHIEVGDKRTKTTLRAGGRWEGGDTYDRKRTKAN